MPIPLRFLFIHIKNNTAKAAKGQSVQGIWRTALDDVELPPLSEAS